MKHLSKDFFVIYDHPADHPNHWACRVWHKGMFSLVPDDHVVLCNSLEAARATLPETAVLRNRRLGEDFTIAEVWVGDYA